mgnify:FL=1
MPNRIETLIFTGIASDINVGTWIGARKDYDSVWRWDGLYKGDVTVSDWRPHWVPTGRPLEHCIEYRYAGWDDTSCNDDENFVCERAL